MPNFLIIGAGRTGTSSLTMYLGQHPEIFLSPVKEPRFFVFVGRDPASIDHPFPEDLITDRRRYEALFEGVTTERAIGEASTEYLTRPGTWSRIRSWIPDVRIIVGLRNPVDRLFSYFLFSVREGLEPERDFARALELDRTRPPETKRAYDRLSRYAPFLRPYYDNFPQSNIFPYLFEDLTRDPASVVEAIAGFLGVSTAFQPDTSTVYNAGQPAGSSSETIRLDPTLRQALLRKTESDIRDTETLTGLDLGSWLDPPDQGAKTEAECEPESASDSAGASRIPPG